MSTLLPVIAAMVLLLAVSTASASEIPNTVPFKTIPVDIPEDLGKAHPWGNHRVQVDFPVYSALTPGTSFLPTDAASPVDGLPYVEYADDCHLIAAGLMTGFKIGYFNATAAPSVDVIVTIYQNDAADTIVGSPIVGPLTVTGLPGGGPNLATVNIPGVIVSTTDIWFAVQFSTPDTGLILTPPPSPTIGVGHDVFLDTGLTSPPPGLVNFQGGDPVANYMIEILVDLETVAVEEVTWGEIKALYGSD